MKQQHINPSSFTEKPSHRVSITHADSGYQIAPHVGEITINHITSEMGIIKDTFLKPYTSQLSSLFDPIKLLTTEKTISDYILELKCILNRYPSITLPPINQGYFYFEKKFEDYGNTPLINSSTVANKYVKYSRLNTGVNAKIPASQPQFIINIGTRHTDRYAIERMTGMYDAFIKSQPNSADPYIKSEYAKYQPGYVHDYGFAQNYPYAYKWEGTNMTFCIQYTAHSFDDTYTSELFYHNCKMNDDELYEVPSTFITLATNALTSPIQSYTIVITLGKSTKLEWLYSFTKTLNMTEEEWKHNFGIDDMVFISNIHIKYFSNDLGDNKYDGEFNTVIDADYIRDQFTIMDGLNDKSNMFVSPFQPTSEKYNANKIWAESMSTINQNGDVNEIESTTNYKELLTLFTPKRIITTHLTRDELDETGMLIEE